MEDGKVVALFSVFLRGIVCSALLIGLLGHKSHT